MDEHSLDRRLLLAMARLVLQLAREMTAAMDSRDANRFRHQYVRPVSELVRRYEEAIEPEHVGDEAGLVTEAMVAQLEQAIAGLAAAAAQSPADDDSRQEPEPERAAAAEPEIQPGNPGFR